VVAGAPTGPVEVPPLVHAFAERIDDVVWQNELGGVTFVAGDRFLKWNPLGSGLDLEEERARLVWARAVGHPVPVVLDLGRDDAGQVLVTQTLNGSGAVSGEWLDRPEVAVRAIADGLRSLHDKLPTAACPFRTRWVPKDAPPPADGAVVLHGDACAPNTIIAADGRFAGHVDLGALGVGDRWADLAVASLSLDWNYGEGWQPLFFETYGIERDEERIALYRAAFETDS
jgi:kanamycin kinase